MSSSLKNNKLLILILFVTLTSLLVCACSQGETELSSSQENTEIPLNTEQINETAAVLTPAAAVTAEPTPEIEQYTTIILGSTGDIMCHLMQLKDAQSTAEGEYNFTRSGNEYYTFDHWFEYISPALEYADLMIGNLETTIAADNSLVSGYPFFASPKELLPALKAAGYDVLLSGNNHILDKQQAGLISTVNALDESGLYHTGAWTSQESKNTPLVVDVNGIKIGIVSATCSLNEQDRLLSQDEKSFMYTMTNDLTQISLLINQAKSAGAEVIVMCPHWGYENATAPDAQSISLAQEYIKLGADIIFAHHPHVLQPVDNVSVTLDDGSTKEGIVFWSLGNFISNQMEEAEMLTSVIAYVSVTKNNYTGEMSFDSSSYLPIWTYISYDSKTNSKTYCVLPVGQALDYPENFESFDAEVLKNPLNAAWLLCVNRLGTGTAQPIRYVSEK